ncbi:MAG: alpha/beta fold hydrolase [Actinomycetota bacterium]
MTTSCNWQQRVGNQRDWVWRGWQTRYTYIPASLSSSRTPTPNPEPTPREGSSNLITSQSGCPSAAPLILLHGFGASIGHWRQNLTELARDRPVYALDFLGFGASQKAPANYSAELWIEQLYDFWRTFIRQPVILVGNSIGSLICLAAAAAHPEMVAGIVMISLPDPAVRVEAVPRWLQPAVAAAENLFASPPILRTLFYFVRRPAMVRRWVSFAYANPEAVTDELVEILAAPASDRGAARAFCGLFKAIGSPHFGPGVKTLLPTLTLPMLLIWGAQDRMIPPRFARPHQFQDYNPQLKLLVLENAGHCPHDECPEQVNQAILDWMADFSP